MKFSIQVAGSQHASLAQAICDEMEESAKVRGTGIAKRSPEYIQKKMEEGKAIIALNEEGQFCGFCYIETWGHGKYVANSGLIVKPDLRKFGLAKQIKQKAFELSRKKYPDAKLFGLTTSLAVMKINSDLGYRPVTFSELTTDEEFWKGCQSCVNYDILTRTNRAHCLCTGMQYDPEKEVRVTKDEGKSRPPVRRHLKIYQRWLRIKQHILMRKFSAISRKQSAPPQNLANV